jgi:hypothetical protein
MLSPVRAERSGEDTTIEIYEGLTIPDDSGVRVLGETLLQAAQALICARAVARVRVKSGRPGNDPGGLR